MSKKQPDINNNKMARQEHGDDLITWLISHIFTASILAFSMDLLKAFLLGIVGALGGLVVKHLYYKIRSWKK